MSDPHTEQIITLKPYMAAILSRLESERTLISVQIGKDRTCYNSILLGIDPQLDLFTLDELNPHKGHKKLRKGSHVHLEARLKGVRIMFSSEINRIDAGEIAMYHLPLPDRMIYRQRRRHHRARLDRQQPMPILFPLPLRHRIQGELVDISASGLCSRIKYSDSTRLEEEQSIQDVRIDLPGQNHITCDLAVRSIRRFPDQGYSLVGSEFVGIAPATQSHVARLVAMLDRHQRRAVHL